MVQFARTDTQELHTISVAAVIAENLRIRCQFVLNENSRAWQYFARTDVFRTIVAMQSGHDHDSNINIQCSNLYFVRCLSWVYACTCILGPYSPSHLRRHVAVLQLNIYILTNHVTTNYRRKCSAEIKIALHCATNYWHNCRRIGLGPRILVDLTIIICYVFTSN